MATSRLIWLDCLRLLAGLSMVVLHTTADPHGQPWTLYHDHARIGPIVLRTIAYTARTELFLLIAVFLLVISLNNRPRSYAETIAEQSRRLLLPFVFWTFFYAAYNTIKASQFGYLDAAINELINPREYLGHFLLGDIKFHMHFLPTLFGLLIFYPLFLVAYRHPVAGLAVFPFLLIKWEIDQQTWSIFWGTDILPFVVRVVKLATYVGFGMAAAAFAAIWQRTDAQQRRQWLACTVFIGLLLLSIKAISGYRTVTEGRWQYDYFAGYWADFLMPLILFFVCMASSDKRWSPLFSVMGKYAFGIYLCHPIFVDISEIYLHATDFSPLNQVALKLVFALTLTPILVVGLSRVPGLAWTIGLGAFPFSLKFPNYRRRSKAHASHD